MLREHLAAAAKRSAKARIELEGPSCPAAAEYLWDWFRELDEGRGGSGFGANPTSFSELAAFERRLGVRFSAFEEGCLRTLDRQALVMLAPEQKKPEPKEAKKK